MQHKKTEWRYDPVGADQALRSPNWHGFENEIQNEQHEQGNGDKARQMKTLFKNTFICVGCDHQYNTVQSVPGWTPSAFTCEKCGDGAFSTRGATEHDDGACYGWRMPTWIEISAHQLTTNNLVLVDENDVFCEWA